MTRRSRGLGILERCLLVAGLICLAIFGGVLLYRTVSSRQALRAFDQARTANVPAKAPAEAPAEVPAKAPEPRQEPAVLKVNEKFNFRWWSEYRVRAYRESLLSEKDSPMAALSIDKLKMRVPVFEGTDELALNRGVGWIAGTARPGEPGNVGIAGHRDGFFRGLKDVSVGDTIKLTTLEGTLVYKVDQFEIVTPDDVSVLRPRGGSSLTLVTCYPFYFVGSAPQRFILHAALNRTAVMQ